MEYLGIWENLYNPGFTPIELEGVRKEAGLNAFTLSPKKRIEATHAIGFMSKFGRYGDAIKQNLIPAEVTPAQASIIYANEADVLNVAMIGMTAKQWREANPEQKGNIRDYASINDLSLEYGEPQCRIYRARNSARGTSRQTELNCHPADEDIGGQQRKEVAESG